MLQCLQIASMVVCAPFDQASQLCTWSVPGEYRFYVNGHETLRSRSYDSMPRCQESVPWSAPARTTYLLYSHAFGNDMTCVIRAFSSLQPLKRPIQRAVDVRAQDKSYVNAGASHWVATLYWLCPFHSIHDSRAHTAWAHSTAVENALKT